MLPMIGSRGTGRIRQTLAQCAGESLILSHMINRDCHIDRFIPVFGGDLAHHMVIHNEGFAE